MRPRFRCSIWKASWSTKNEFVSRRVGFWDGRNISIERNDVTTGMYLVKITFRGQTVVQDPGHFALSAAIVKARGSNP